MNPYDYAKAVTPLIFDPLLAFTDPQIRRLVMEQPERLQTWADDPEWVVYGMPAGDYLGVG